MNFYLALLAILGPLIVLVLIYLRSKFSSRRSNSSNNVTRIEDEILSVVKINYRGVRQSLIDIMNTKDKKVHEYVDRMPSFMYEATDDATINRFELPDEIRMAITNLRMFVSDNTSIALRILKEAETHHYDDKETIFDEDTAIKFIYIVIYGKVTIKTRMLDITDTFQHFIAGDCIFNSLNILQGMTSSPNRAKASAYASGECALLKIPIEFFHQSGNNLKFIETAITWTERFVYDIMINMLNLTDYLSTKDHLVKCSCNCDDADNLISNSSEILRRKLDFDNDDFNAIFEKGEIINYQNQELLTNWQNYLHFVTHGSLEQFIKKDTQKKRTSIIKWSVCDFFGVHNIFIDRPKDYKVRSLTKNTTIIRWESKTALELAAKYPKFLDILIKSYISDYSALMSSLEWSATQIEFPPNTMIKKSYLKEDAIYVIISGRIRSVVENTNRTNKPVVIQEFGHGDLITLNPNLINTPRDYSFIALRFTTMICLPYHVIKIVESIIASNVTIFNHIYHQLAEKMYMSDKDRYFDGVLSNVRTIAVVNGGTSDAIMMNSFSKELFKYVEHYKKSILLNSEIIMDKFNKDDIEKIASLKLISYLSLLETQYDSLLLVCDYNMSKWTSHVLEQADVVVIVLNFSDQNKMPQGIESKLDKMKSKTAKILAFLHPHSTRLIYGTDEWLKLRNGYHMHFHIRCPPTFFSSRYQRSNEILPTNHFARLARHLTGNAYGLALSSGGAKGFAHVGIIQEFHAKNVPIDMISGTSMGAYVGGVYAIHEDPEEVQKYALLFVSTFKMKLNFVTDITIPVVSIFNGKNFSKLLDQTFGKMKIEDFWIPFYSCSTDLTSESKSIHKAGPAAFYVQASMTVVGLLPPVCDPLNSHLLVDGAYTNIIPAVDLVEAGCKKVFAVIVNPNEVGTYYGNYGRVLSASKALFYRFLPFHSNSIPSYFEITNLLSFISSAVAQEALYENKEAITILRPNLSKFSAADFSDYPAIRDVGIETAKEFLERITCLPCFTGNQKQCDLCMNTLNDSLNQSNRELQTTLILP